MKRALVVTTAAFLLALSGWMVTRHYQTSVRRASIGKEARKAAGVFSLELTTGMHERIKLLVEQEQLRTALRTSDPATLAPVQSRLEGAATVFGADIVYLMNEEGTVVISARGREGKSLAGNNYAFRPYFKNAMDGSSVSYPALGVTTGKLGLYLSDPVRDPETDQIVGVLVVKIGLAHLRQHLDGFEETMCLLTEDGVVVATNSDLDIPVALFTLPPQIEDQMKTSKQFGVDGPKELGWKFHDKTLSLDGQSRLADQIPVPETPFSLLVWSRRTLAWWPPVLVAALCAAAALVFSLVLSQARRRREAQKSLRLYGQMLEHSANAVAVTDLKGNLEYVNPAFCRLTGYTMDEVLGKNPRVLKSGKQSKEFYADLWRTILDGKEWRGEFHNRRKDGTLFWESASISPVRGEDGTIAHFLAVKEDITARKKAEERLRESLDFHLQLLEDFPVPVWRTDRDGRCDYVNRAMCELLGRTKETILKDDWLHAVYPEDAVRFATAREKAIQARQPMEQDLRVKTANGTHDWVITRAIPFQNLEGAYVGYLGTCVDINETRSAQEQLLRKNMYVELLQRASQKVNEAETADEAIQSCLDLICEFTGWPLGYARWLHQGTPLMDRWAKKDERAYRDFREQVEKNPSQWDCPLHGRRLKAGEPVWIGDFLKEEGCAQARIAREARLRSSLVFPVVVGADDLVVIQFFAPTVQAVDQGFLQVLRTLALQLPRTIQRKLDQEALQESEERFRTISKSALDAIFMIDGEGKIVFSNPAAERIFGYAGSEMEGQPVHDILTPRQLRDQAHQGFLHFRTSGQGPAVGKVLELTALHKDGHEFPIEIAVSGIRKDQQWQAIAIVRDITERKRLQQQLTQAQKLEAIGSLAAGVAHEINTPTQYVSDNTHFLQEAFGDLQPALDAYAKLLSAAEHGGDVKAPAAEAREAREKADLDYLRAEIPNALKQSVEGLSRVSELVKAMKEFSHPSAKEKTPVDLNHAVRTTATVASNEWKYCADLEFLLDPDLPMVSCLPNEFNQCVLNLIVNAAHAIEAKNGKREGAKGRITLRTSQHGGMAEIRVQDTGTGIPVEVRDRIFDPFFTTKEVGKGTGQGLSIARSTIVDKLNGTLDFETEDGEGTTFIIRLPLGTDPAAVTGESMRSR